MTGGRAAFTVTFTAADGSLLCWLLTTTAYCAPLSLIESTGVSYVGPLAPGIATEPFIHWYLIVGEPDACTAKCAACPASTLAATGWVVTCTGANGTTLS